MRTLARSRIGLLLMVVLATLAIGCSRRRPSGPPPGDAGPRADGAIVFDGGTTDPRCPGSPVFSFFTCGESQSGAVCPGTVSCSCGSLATSCVCGPAEVGYQFLCTDDCSGCSTPMDGGVPPGSTCAAAYDRLNTTPGCPFPETLTRDAYVMFCEQVRSRSAMCASQMDAYNACALEASVECVDAGGMLLPNPIGCPTIDTACLDAG